MGIIKKTFRFLRSFTSSRTAAVLLGALVAGPAMATVELRVEARPISDPIQAFITVTDANGDAVTGLTAGDFTVTLDGVPVTIQAADLTLPPSQDPNRKVSVVFAMDYSASVTNVALTAMQSAIVTFVEGMTDGDYAAIVKFNDTNPDGASVVLPFTEIDHGVGNQALADAVMADYPGDGTNLLDAINVAINHILSPPNPLPAGPKAIILVSDGGENESAITESEVIAFANANSIPVFSVGVGNITNRNEALLTALGTETGGDFIPAPTDQEIADAYASISTILNNEYLLSIPSGISDCAAHTLEVAVVNQATPANIAFTRRVCDTTPDPFTFTNQTGVAVGTAVTSNTVTVTGLEVPADISTQIGTYSIGCNGTFTGASGTISNGQTVCVQHTSSAAPSTTNTTTLTIGGVSAAFTSTTRAASGGGGGGGGGGAMGGLELLAGLAVLFSRRRRRA